jgi:hypothetical protein
MTTLTIRERTERVILAQKVARCEGEKAAIVWEGYGPGQAECGNCGHAFPPESVTDEGRRVYCANWESHASVMYFCRAWLHNSDHAAGVAPPWAKAYSKERIAAGQLLTVVRGARTE